eukprot:jgi/Mesvir1/12439/Mv00601-RA.1
MDFGPVAVFFLGQLVQAESRLKQLLNLKEPHLIGNVNLVEHAGAFLDWQPKRRQPLASRAFNRNDLAYRHALWLEQEGMVADSQQMYRTIAERAHKSSKAAVQALWRLACTVTDDAARDTYLERIADGCPPLKPMVLLQKRRTLQQRLSTAKARSAESRTYYWWLHEQDRKVEHVAESVLAAADTALIAGFPRSQEAAEVRWDAAMCAMENARDADACGHLDAIIDSRVNSGFVAGALYWRARLHRWKGEPARAQRLLSRLQDRFPQSYYAWCAASLAPPATSANAPASATTGRAAGSTTIHRDATSPPSSRAANGQDLASALGVDISATRAPGWMLKRRGPSLPNAALDGSALLRQAGDRWRHATTGWARALAPLMLAAGLGREQAPPLPVGSIQLRRLYQSGRFAEAWDHWQRHDYVNERDPSLAEALTDALLRLSVGDTQRGMLDLSESYHRAKSPAEVALCLSLERCPSFLRAVYPLSSSHFRGHLPAKPHTGAAGAAVAVAYAGSDTATNDNNNQAPTSPRRRHWVWSGVNGGQGQSTDKGRVKDTDHRKAGLMAQLRWGWAGGAMPGRGGDDTWRPGGWVMPPGVSHVFAAVPWLQQRQPEGDPVSSPSKRPSGGGPGSQLSGDARVKAAGATGVAPGAAPSTRGDAGDGDWERVLFWSRQHEVDPLLVMALIRQESGFNTMAVSQTGARGLMQLMPSTSTWVAKVLGMRSYSLHNAEDNLRLGTWYLGWVGQLYGGGALVPTIAAYNAGSGHVDAWLDELRGKTWDEFVEQIPFGETRYYVKAVLGAYWMYHRLYNGTSRGDALRRAVTS